ncbi:MAG TPA: ABC transporter ATP-binding protein [Candidatus Limnocylindria bacterium]|nr:ABC transporter ATP-binding protein [Candidatus Limnocylindria bacterium]
MKLELRGITKRFPGVVANEGVDLVVNPGEIVGLLGENGAGKTTLMNVLYGLYQPDEGEILIDDKPVRFAGPSDAIAAGIGMVHQHFMLVPVFTVTENVMLGVESTRPPFGRLDEPAARRRIMDISERHGLKVDPDAVVEDLPVGVRQRVEIIKTLYRFSDVLILDEPSAVLTPQETEDLFGVMRSLIEHGTGIIFITHKLDEVLTVADRISVLRRGKVVGETTPAETSEEELAAMMVGRSVELVVHKEPAQPKAPVLEINDLVVRDERGHAAVNELDLTVRAGEILAVAGVQGNGQTELVQAITGLRPRDSGSIRIDGQEMDGTPREIYKAGVAHVPEDRLEDGLVVDFSVAENLVLNNYWTDTFANGLNLDRDAIASAADERVRDFDIRTPSIFNPVGNLSGGNQQKVIAAREFSRPGVKLVVASQPTRGLDVGSIEYIHKRIVERRDAGAAVLIVSSELDEVTALGDRIAVMYQGKIVATLSPEEATFERLGLLMGGAHPEDQVASPELAAEVLAAPAGDARHD